MALYIPHIIFHLARLFVSQGGNFWTLQRRNSSVSLQFAKYTATPKKKKIEITFNEPISTLDNSEQLMRWEGCMGKRPWHNLTL